MFPLHYFSSASQGSIKPRSSREKAYHTTIYNPDRRYQPFFWRRCRGSNFAIPVRLLETLLVSFILVLSLFTVISLPFCHLFENPKKLVTCFYHASYSKTHKN